MLITNSRTIESEPCPPAGYTEEQYERAVDNLLKLAPEIRLKTLGKWLDAPELVDLPLRLMLQRLRIDVGKPTFDAMQKAKAPTKYNVCVKFYSGEQKSFTQFYMADIQTSPAFQALTAQEQLLLFDMIRECNYQAYKLKEKIETQGFVYVHSQCRVNIPYNGFHKRVQRLVAMGWFRCVKVRKTTGGEINRYFPSDNWKQCTGPN